jgi:hypothetical protein
MQTETAVASELDTGRLLSLYREMLIIRRT